MPKINGVLSHECQGTRFGLVDEGIEAEVKIDTLRTRKVFKTRSEQSWVQP